MKTIALGSQGLSVSELGYGCMGLTSSYGTKLPDEDIVKLLKKVYEHGVTLWDTANVYVFQKGSELVCQEEVIAHAIKEVGRENIVIATKTGLKLILEPEMGAVPCGDPEFIRKECENSLRRLGVDYLDLLYLHRIDQNIPIEITVAALRDLVDEGKVKYIGLSECSAATLRRAHKVHPVSCIQMEYSLWCRQIEEDVIPACAELGVGLVAYAPLGRGFLGGAVKSAEDIPEGDYRKSEGRMAGDALRKNAKLLETLENIAKDKNATTAQLSLAWLQHQQFRLEGAGIVAIPGTTKEKNLICNVESLNVKLSDDELQTLESAVKADEVVGSRYEGDLAQATWEADNNKELAPEEAAKYYR